MTPLRTFLDTFVTNRTGLSNSDIAQAANTCTTPTASSYFINARSILNVVLDPVRLEVILSAINSVSPTLVSILKQVGDNRGNGGGIDISKPAAQAFIDTLVNPQLFTSAEAASLKALGKKSILARFNAGLPEITADAVASALAEQA